MNFRRCPVPSCGRPYQVNRFDAAGMRAGVAGNIVCPHCGSAVKGEDDAVFVTHALSILQEREFNGADVRQAA
jgi:hypothetical protein